MPTSTEYFGYDLTNIGPLTTTFTPAPSCTNHPPKQYGVVESDGRFAGWYLGPGGCDNRSVSQGCYPSADVVNYIPGRDDVKELLQTIAYFSPGLHCPSGWATVGSAVGGGGTSGDKGIFTETPTSGAARIGMPFNQLFSSILDPGETAVWCCPSSYTMTNEAICISSVRQMSAEDYSDFDTICFSGHTYPWSRRIASTVTEASSTGEPIPSPTFSTYDEWDDFTVVQTTFPIKMVHHATDAADNGGDGPVSARNLSLLPLTAVLIGGLVGAGLLVPW